MVPYPSLPDTSGCGPTLGLRAVPHLPGRGASARRDRRSRRDRGAGRARLAGARDRFGDSTDMCSLVNAKSGGCAEDCGFCAQSRFAEADTPMHAMMDRGPDPRARPGRRGRGRAPLLHGHPGPGPLEARLREHPRRRPARLRAHEPEALRLDRPHVAPRARRRSRRPASSAFTTTSRPPRATTPRSRRRSATRAGCARSTRCGGRARDLRRRHPQPRRVTRAARGDGLPARGARPHVACRSTC